MSRRIAEPALPVRRAHCQLAGKRTCGQRVAAGLRPLALGPILMTTLAMIFGMLPLALGLAKAPSSARADGAGAGLPAYHEFNFSPSSEWAAYAFSAYRVAVSLPAQNVAPPIAVRFAPERLKIETDGNLL